MIIRRVIFVVSFLLVLSLTGCANQGGEVAGKGDEVVAGEVNTSIAFDKDKVNADNTDGVSVSDREVKITKSGLYTLSGTWNDGQIVVDMDKESEAVLLLDGVNITNTKSAPIYIKSADKVKIELADGKDNILTDAEFYVFDDPQETKPNACIYGKDDITIKGSGNLTVNANYNNGIGTKNDLKITGGNITINAFNNGLKGNDSMTITGGNIEITAAGDGIEVTNEEDIDKGFVKISGGKIKIKAKDDAIKGVTGVSIHNADVKVSADGEDVKCEGPKYIDEDCISPLEPDDTVSGDL